MEIEGWDAGSEKDVSRYKFASFKALFLETLVSHDSPSSSSKEQICVLSQSMLSLRKPLRKCTKTGLEVTSKRTVWRCFPRIVTCCCDILDVRYISFIRQRARRDHPCVECAFSFDDMVHSKKRPNCLWTRRFGTSQQIESL